MYYLKCLGPPVLERDGTEIRLARKKSLALLAYLAVTRQPESRDALAALLWPDQPPAPAFGYLRTALYDINAACTERIIDADRQAVRLAERAALDVDVWKFRELLDGHRKRPPGRTRLAEAVCLFRGSFLSGFSLKDAPAFEDWQRECGEDLAQTCEEALKDLIHACVDEGDTAEALALAKRLLSMDELDEHYHRMLMSLEALAGKPVAVDLAWQRCCRILKRELDAQPAEETRKLYDRVRSARGTDADQRLVRDLLGGLLGESGSSRPSWAPSRAVGPSVVAAPPASRLPEEMYPTSVAVDSRGRIYFTDAGSCRVARMDDMEGRGMVAFGSEGDAPGQFRGFGAVCLDARGRIYTADIFKNRISRFDAMDGSGCITFGSTGSGAGCFDGPTGICVDGRGRIIVADFGNNRIVRFDDMNGSGWVTLGGPDPGEGPGQFASPFDVAVDTTGRIHVSEHPAAVVRMDDMDGSGWTMVRPANLRLPRVGYTRGLAIDPEQNAMYLAVNFAVLRIADLMGLRWASLGVRPGASRMRPEPGDTMQPRRVCLDARHRIYIADAYKHRIVRVDDIYGNGWVEYPPPAAACGGADP